VPSFVLCYTIPLHRTRFDMRHSVDIIRINDRASDWPLPGRAFDCGDASFSLCWNALAE
jgi:hypothetical protein